MEIPELVREQLGGEELQTGIMLGDEDVLCLTPTRTLLYRAEGLLSDESVTEFPHELERLSRSEGRRKTKFDFEYVEDQQSLTVPNDVADDVLDLLLEGVLTTDRILDEDEGVVGAFRFSELTLVIGQRRVVKHVGNAVWEDDFEVYRFEDLTGLEFEKASVATEIVMRVDGRPQRIKTPNDKARIVEKTLQKAVFEFFEVTSMSELQAHFAETATDESETDDDPTGSDEFAFGSEIKPLGGDGESERPASEPEAMDETIAEAETVDEVHPTDVDSVAEAGSGTGESESGGGGESNAATTEDLDAIGEQLSELTTAVNRQNELLRKQHAAIKQLIEELRQGR